MPKYQVDLSVTIRLTVEVEAPDIDTCWKDGNRIAADALRIYAGKAVTDFEAPAGGLVANGVIFLAESTSLLDYYLDEVEMVRALLPPGGAA